jgi:hypothetical protein
MTEQDAQILRLTADVQALKMTLGTLIAWMSQSANSPIRADEARKLLEGLEAKKPA